MRAGLDERALVQRLVVVAIEEHQIAAPQHGVGDHLVGGARAVQHEVGLVGAEHLRRVLLRARGGAFVNEEIAEVDVGVAQVVAEDALAEMLEEQLARRRFSVELATLVARAVEGDVGLGIVGHEPAKERRQQAHPVVDDARHDLLGVEGGGLLSDVDVALDLSEHPQHGDVGDTGRIGERPERRQEADGPHVARQLPGPLAPIAVDERDVGAHAGVLGDVAIEVIGHFDLEALGGNIVEQLPGVRVLVVDDGDHFQELLKGDRNRRRLRREFDHDHGPRTLQRPTRERLTHAAAG